jgi:hypothetical protein
MRACRLTLQLVAMLGGAVLITAELTAHITQPTRLWALCLLSLVLATAGGLWVGEKFRRLEGVVTTVVLTNTARSAPPDYGDDNTRSNGRRRGHTDADILDLFRQE